MRSIYNFVYRSFFMFFFIRFITNFVFFFFSSPLYLFQFVNDSLHVFFNFCLLDIECGQQNCKTLYSIWLLALNSTVSETIKPIKVYLIHINAHSQWRTKQQRIFKKKKKTTRYADMMNSKDIIRQYTQKYKNKKIKKTEKDG